MAKSGMTRHRLRIVRGVILGCLLNEDQNLAKEISERSLEIAKDSDGMITPEEIRASLDPWVKYKPKR